jgi:hypothetical protein
MFGAVVMPATSRFAAKGYPGIRLHCGLGRFSLLLSASSGSAELFQFE